MTAVGIVIVHFHSESLLSQSLTRLRDSDLADFRAWVIDNGSSENLAELIANVDSPRSGRFALHDSRANLGFAAAANIGIGKLIQEAKNENDLRYVLLLNPDVLVEASTLRLMVKQLDDLPEAAAATCRLDLPSGQIDPACRRSEPTMATAAFKFLGLSRLMPNNSRIGRYNLSHLDPEQEIPIEACSGAFMMIRRAALEGVGARLDERFFLYGEDLDLCRRLREAGGELRYFPSSRALHIKGSGRIRSTRVTIQFYRAIWRYYRKWGPGRHNPLVLVPLLACIGLLGGVEIARNRILALLRDGPGSGENLER